MCNGDPDNACLAVVTHYNALSGAYSVYAGLSCKAEKLVKSYVREIDGRASAGRISPRNVD